MSFLGLDLNPRSFVAGFAERDMELRDKAREESMGLVKDTLNYRAEMAIRNKREKEDLLKTDLQKGKRLLGLGVNFTVDQIGVLAGNGQLDQVLSLYEKAQEAGVALPDAATVVSVASETPVDMPLEEYLRQIRIGTFVSEKSQADLGIKPPYKSKNKVFGFLDPYAQAADEAEKYGDRYASQLGMTPQEITAYAFDDLERTMPEGSVNLGGFAGITEDYRVASRQAIRDVGSTVAGRMGMGNVYDIYNNYDPRVKRDVKDEAFEIIQAQLGREIGSRLRGDAAQGILPEKYEDIVSDLQFKLRSRDGIVGYFNSIPEEDRMGVDIETVIPPSSPSTVTPGSGSIAGLTSGAILTDPIRDQISNATKISDLVDIANQVAQVTGGGADVAKEIKTILRNNRGKPIQDLIDMILNLQASADMPAPATDDAATETQIAQSITGQPDNAIAGEEPDVMPEQEIASTTSALQEAGVDTTDIVAVRSTLAGASEQIYDQARDGYISPESFDDDLNAEIDRLAQTIVDYSQSTRIA